MSKSPAKTIIIGFLTVRPTAKGGRRGGYLLTTEHGKPVEFHYTTDFRLPPNQQPLFGKYIEQYVDAEVLAKPLTDRQRSAPKIVLVDRPSLLLLRRLIPAPVILLEAAQTAAAASPSPNTSSEPAVPTMSPPTADEAHGAASDATYPAIPAANQTLRSWHATVHTDHPEDRQAFDKLRSLTLENFDWLEPFERLEIALAQIRDPEASLVA